jgi:tRNA pseudouridine55 synthase
MTEMKDGLLLLDKDPGFTSHDAVQRTRRVLKQKKIGHCGTLDPDATGLLLLTLGTATRLTRFLIRAPKVYEGVIGFEGEIQQQPPPYSAKKIQGVKYYELARRGEEVPSETKDVTVYELSPVGEIEEGGRLRFRLSCSSGTYARGLAHDLGAALGVGAHLAELRRTRIGGFRTEDALRLPRLEELVQAGEPLGAAWVPFDQIPLPFGEVTADPQQEHRIAHGQTVLVRELAGEEGDWVKLINRRREFIAVGTVTERIGTAGVGIVQPRVVFR